MASNGIHAFLVVASSGSPTLADEPVVVFATRFVISVCQGARSISGRFASTSSDYLGFDWSGATTDATPRHRRKHRRRDFVEELRLRSSGAMWVQSRRCR